MTVCLDDTETSVARVHLRDVCALFALVRDSTLTSQEQIRRRYCERAADFDTTLEFVRDLGYIRDINGILSLDSNVAEMKNARAFAAELLRRAVTRRNRFQQDLRDYLGTFRVVDERVICFPRVRQTVQESCIR